MSALFLLAASFAAIIAVGTLAVLVNDVVESRLGGAAGDVRDSGQGQLGHARGPAAGTALECGGRTVRIAERPGAWVGGRHQG